MGATAPEDAASAYNFPGSDAHFPRGAESAEDGVPREAVASVGLRETAGTGQTSAEAETRGTPGSNFYANVKDAERFGIIFKLVRLPIPSAGRINENGGPGQADVQVQLR